MNPRFRRARRTGAVTVAACAVALGAAACNGSSSGAVGPGSTIKVGVISDLTGSDAEFGQIYSQGAKLAFTGIKGGKIDGHPVTFTYYDDASDPATATSVARKAIQQDKVDVIYGQPYTQSALAVANVASALHVAFFNPGSSANALTTPLQKYVFAGQFSADAYGQAVAKLICSMGVHKVGMVYESDTYGTQNLAAMKKFLPGCGLSVNDAEAIGATDTSALTQLNHLRSSGVQVIVDGTVAGPSVALLKGEVSTGFQVPTMSFAGEVASIDQVLAANPKLTFYTVTPIACPTLGSCTDQVRQRWQAAYHTSTIAPWSAQAYAEGEAFVHGLAAYSNNMKAGVTAAFETMSPYSTPVLTHPIQFSATNHRGLGECSMEGISNGHVTFFGTSIKQNTLTAPVGLSQ